VSNQQVTSGHFVRKSIELIVVSRKKHVIGFTKKEVRVIELTDEENGCFVISGTDKW